jgi:hypothetical protein
MKELNKIEILKKLKGEFVKEEKAEPFQNREYVKESTRIFNMLIDGFDFGKNETDNATFDIVDDIFRYFKKK